ncbi:hypothetical protein BDW62DRAFT_200844 [Aspergillus aurantiobrunneus]
MSAKPRQETHPPGIDAKGTQFKVVIVGGSIAGLTLAHCLSRAGIDYVVLEKRNEIAPQVGASIGIMPHGGRIMDQLGLFDAVERLIEPLHTAHISYPDGFEHTNRSPMLLEKRFGLPLAFLERQKMLEVLYGHLPDPSRVLVGSAVVSVDQDDAGQASVCTGDGSIYKGDLVVGADGVHSCVRGQMWRLADKLQPGLISKEEKTGQSVRMKIEYACVFGISAGVPGLDVGEQITSLNDHRSYLVFPGKNGRIFWFLLRRLDQVYTYPDGPRYSTEDAERTCAKHANDHIWKGVRFADIWEKREVFSMTNLEEHVFQTWHYGRVVCIGDSMHKMAPNTGQGANCAIEDAAALTNLLIQALKSRPHGCKLSNQEVHGLLHTFNNDRLHRVRNIYKGASFVVRLQARYSLPLRLLGRYYLPHSGDLPADTASKVIAGAGDLEFLPPSQRLGPGWHRFRPKKHVLHSYTVGAMGLLLLLSAMTWLRQDLLRFLLHG